VAQAILARQNTAARTGRRALRPRSHVRLGFERAAVGAPELPEWQHAHVTKCHRPERGRSYPVVARQPRLSIREHRWRDTREPDWRKIRAAQSSAERNSRQWAHGTALKHLARASASIFPALRFRPMRPCCAPGGSRRCRKKTKSASFRLRRTCRRTDFAKPGLRQDLRRGSSPNVRCCLCGRSRLHRHARSVCRN
jgi:hypothetical protein